jgi:hypothetical protein
MPTKQPYCRHCHHSAHRADCGVDDCGCIKYEPRDTAAREARKRSWLVDVQFFVKNRWIDATQQRVKAAGQGGAAMQGIRAAKGAVLRPRQRTEQVKVTITPVKGSGR